MNYNYIAQDFNMIAYLDPVNELLRDFNYVAKQISQGEKKKHELMLWLSWLSHLRKTY